MAVVATLLPPPPELVVACSRRRVTQQEAAVRSRGVPPLAAAAKRGSLVAAVADVGAGAPPAVVESLKINYFFYFLLLFSINKKTNRNVLDVLQSRGGLLLQPPHNNRPRSRHIDENRIHRRQYLRILWSAPSAAAATVISMGRHFINEDEDDAKMIFSKLKKD